MTVPEELCDPVFAKGCDKDLILGLVYEQDSSIARVRSQDLFSLVEALAPDRASDLLPHFCIP